MKRTIGVLAATVLLAGMALLAGCGGSSGQAGDSGTQASESTQQGAQSGMQGGTVSEPDLAGVPIYPGAEKQTMQAGGPGGMGATGGGTPPAGSTTPSGSTSGSGNMPAPPSGGTPPSGGMSMVMYTTTDAVDVVTEWYRGQLSGMDGFTETTGTAGPDGSSQTVFTFEVNDTTMSMAVGAGMQGSSGTMIRIAEGAMQAPSGTPPGQSQ